MPRAALAAAALALCVAFPARAEFSTVRIAAGLTRPVFVTAPPGDSGRLFVVQLRVASESVPGQQDGLILVVDRADDTILPTPFLTVPALATGGEQGLLGLAFHPDYAQNGLFYVNYTDPDTRVVRYQVSADPDIADASSGLAILSLAQPQANHNGGWLAFGPDGYLYVGIGDGGGSSDDDAGHTPGVGNGQDTGTLLGKILRIDVDTDDFPGDATRNYGIPPMNPFVGTEGADEIWAYGLRNPWRASFDRQTGDMYIGDVGQGSREEIDVQPATSAGGENYGWRVREGSIATPNVGGPAPPGSFGPIFDYPHSGADFAGCSVTGGSVYRGPVEALQGLYFFSDYCTSRLWSLRFDGSEPQDFDGTNFTELSDWTGDPRLTPDQGTFNQVASFGEDHDGNLYVVDLDGEIFRVPEPPQAALLAIAFGALALRRRRSSVNARREALPSSHASGSGAG